MTLNAPIVWVGGKHYLAKWIVSFMPRHKCFVDVFGGAGNVLLNKPTSTVEVYNDVNGDLVNLYRVIQSQPDEFQEAVSNMLYSRKIFNELRDLYKFGDWNGVSDFWRAVNFFYLVNISFSGKIGGGFGYSVIVNTASKYQSKCRRLPEVYERFKRVVIECLDFEDVINRYDSPDTLFYLDPPYIGTEYYYKKCTFGLDDHTRLANVLDKIEGKAMVSYYPDDRIYDLYRGWHIEKTTSTKYSEKVKNGNRQESTELLFMNFNPKDMTPQVPLGQMQFGDSYGRQI